MLYNLSRLPATIRGEIINSETLSAFFNEKPNSLLSVNADAKTVKGVKMGYLTGILYLTPANSSGINLCPMAEIAQCAAPCLFTAGRGRMSTVYFARLRKTLFLQQYEAEFMALLAKDIKKIEKKAAKKGFSAAIRLNGTSDIRFENILLNGENIMAHFPHIMFYDYTKLHNRKDIPSNYDLTYSYSGVSNFAQYAKSAIDNGMRLAVVFRNRETVEYMLNYGVKYMGLDIVDGDSTDLRFLEPQGVISALYAKGRAKMDGSGFVIDMPEEMAAMLA